VLLFIPNLIGYSRVVFTLSSFVLMVGFPQYWCLAISLYVSSFIGDLFDGMAARKFNQCSTFGGLLDMVTDRCSTLGILYILGGNYAPQDTHLGFPFFRLSFLMLILLDISSHWCQMHSTMSLHETHHKSQESNQGRNVIVRLYYQYYWFFGYLCVGAEFTYICLYMRQYVEADSLWGTCNTALLYACLPGCFLKQIVNVAQLGSACYAVASYDAQQRNQVKQS
jgi:CDP-diacylglycerol--inositol 3-phosphatidyltransferase